MKSHLCGFTTSESARSQPSSTWRISGTTAAEPPYAASTCSHMPWRAHTSATAATGSTLVVDVVPTVATAARGRTPAATSAATASSNRSARIRNSASVAILQSPSWPSPSAMQAFSTEECAWSEV